MDMVTIKIQEHCDQTSALTGEQRIDASSTVSVIIDTHDRTQEKPSRLLIHMKGLLSSSASLSLHREITP
jgi:hypothetical protein